jgi:N-methylhydantoinase B/oxoprolinase/acetone carboxylase alpha subunit
MKIQINTDKTLNGDSRMQKYFSSLIEKSFNRFQSKISRIEVHLKDSNGNKKGVNDKICLLEARIKGRKPIAISCEANTLELAFEGGISKMETAMNTIIGRLKNQY